MDALDRLAAAAENLCTTLIEAGDAPLAARVEALAVAVAELYAAGRVLPPAPPVAEPSPAPGSADFPGLGAFDEVLRSASPLDSGGVAEPAHTSDALLRVAAHAWSGLERWRQGDVERAVLAWAGGWPNWSGDALFALTVLHAASARFRPAAPKAPRSSRATPVVLDRPKARGWLGVRFEPLGIGVLVREVAAGGPADGLVEPGDVLLSADGVMLDHLDPQEIARHLVAPPGESRLVEVYRDGATREIRLISARAR